MEKIPTAEEILNDRVYITQDGIEDVHDSISTVAEAMIEFAILHVEAALKAKVKAMTEKSYEDSSYSMNELDSFTRNSYPLENIK